MGQGSIYVLASSESGHHQPRAPPKHTGWIPHYYQKSSNQACSQGMWLQPFSVVTYGFWITPDTGDVVFCKLTQIILPKYPKVPVCSYLSPPRNWNCNLFLYCRLCYDLWHESTYECAHTKYCVVRGWQDGRGDEGQEHPDCALHYLSFMGHCRCGIEAQYELAHWDSKQSHHETRPVLLDLVCWIWHRKRYLSDCNTASGSGLNELNYLMDGIKDKMTIH